MNTSIYKLLSQSLGFTEKQIEKTIELLDSGKYTHEQIMEILQFLQKQLFCKNPEKGCFWKNPHR